MATLATLRLINDFRNDLIREAEDIKDDFLPTSWGDIFVPSGHYKALRLDTMIVEGMRGAGKSFWTEVLRRPELRKQLIANVPILDLDQLVDCKSVSWDRRADQDLPTKTTVKRLLAKPEFEVSLFWAAVILAQFPDDVSPYLDEEDSADHWSARISWAQENPEIVHRLLKTIDSKYAQKKQCVMVVIDGLDVVSSSFPDTRRLLRGLFELLLDFRHAKGLRMKVFVREDMISRSQADFSDASKLFNEKVNLDWTQEDLYALVYHYMGQRSPRFRSLVSRVTKITWPRNGLDHAELFNAASQERVFIALAGPYMGNQPTKGHVYRWLFNHLADGKRRVSPRTFLKAIKAALEETKSRFASHPYVMHHEGIRQGVRRASEDRVMELANEYHWVENALQPLKTNKLAVPLDWSKLQYCWTKGRTAGSSTVQNIEALSKQRDWLIPWDMEDKSLEKDVALRDALVDIGVMQIRVKQDLLRIDLPDIYRLGYGIGRFGGISRAKV